MTLWITEGDVVSLMHLGDAISALEEGLKLEAAGEAANMVKTHAVWGGRNTLHAIGATFEGAGFVGTKTWGHTSWRRHAPAYPLGQRLRRARGRHRGLRPGTDAHRRHVRGGEPLAGGRRRP